MKINKIELIVAALLTAVITGCSTTTPETTTSIKMPPKGLKVIERNLKSVSPMPNTSTSGAGCYELLSSLSDDIKPNCSLLFIEVKPGEELIKHSVTNDLIIYVITGGGNLTIDGHAYIMSSGETIYVPSGKSRHILNNSKKTLKFLMYITPAHKPADITVLQERRPEHQTKQQLQAEQNKAIAKKVLGKDAQNIGKENIQNVQELTPNETKVPSTPPDKTLQ